MTKTVQYQNELHKFLIWDTAGQERVSDMCFLSFFFINLEGCEIRMECLLFVFLNQNTLIEQLNTVINYYDAALTTYQLTCRVLEEVRQS